MINNLNIRCVNQKDLSFIFLLNNEPLVRENSYNSEPINFEDHKIWFKAQLKNKNSQIYIIENSNIPVGQVRFTVKENHTVIGISISNKFRGKGYAFEGLELAVKEYFKNINKPIYAYIKKSNSASIRLFEKAGFKYYRDEVVNKIDSYVYKIG